MKARTTPEAAQAAVLAHIVRAKALIAHSDDDDGETCTRVLLVAEKMLADVLVTLQVPMTAATMSDIGTTVLDVHSVIEAALAADDSEEVRRRAAAEAACEHIMSCMGTLHEVEAWPEDVAAEPAAEAEKTPRRIVPAVGFGLEYRVKRVQSLSHILHDLMCKEDDVPDTDDDDPLGRVQRQFACLESIQSHLDELCCMIVKEAA